MNIESIRERMKVVGTVDHIEGEEVCLRQSAQEACSQWRTD